MLTKRELKLIVQALDWWYKDFASHTGIKSEVNELRSMLRERLKKI